MQEYTIIGHYTILRPLGKGGMGEVYLAEDTKLDRQVAIKVLPDAVRQDPERLARFRREAKAAASLQHPNIATIFSLEEAIPSETTNPAGSQLIAPSPDSDGTDGTIHFIIMEYVDGETLADIIPPDGLDVGVKDGNGRTGAINRAPAFFDIFIPLADALSHAHQQGRVHRDIKPANIMIAEDGTPKILDFGLARIMPVEEAEAANQLDSEDETLSLPADQLNKPVKPPSDPSAMSPGPKLMGTPQYMSPEQAESEPLDHRTDIFSFGVVMYEALTGKKAFEGKSRQSLLASIIKADPVPAPALKPVTPYQLWMVVERCLRKDRMDRTQTAQELCSDLRSAQKDVESGTVLVDPKTIPEPEPVREESPPDPVPFWKQPAAIGCAVIILIVGLGTAWFLKPVPEMPEPPLRKFTLPVDWMSDGGGTAYSGPAISPDGRMIVYQQGVFPNSTLWIRDLDTVTPRELPDTEGATRPFWSPGSDFVAYFAGVPAGELRKVAVSGGPSIPLCDIPVPATRGGIWLPDGTIVFGVGLRLFNTDGSLYRVSSQGGEPIAWATADSGQGQQGLIYPNLLPDGSLMYAATMDEGGVLIAQQAENRRVLLSNRGELVAFPVYSPTGHILYQRGFPESKGIWAAPFDGTRVTGESFLVDANGGYPTVSSSDGTLVYRSANTSRRQLIWVDRQGDTESVGSGWEGLRGPALSPDGRSVAFSAFSQNNRDIWIYDLERNTTTRLTFDSGVETHPVWSPDSRWVAFESSRSSNQNDIYVKAADGSGNVALLVKGTGRNTPYAWSRDGRYLIYRNLPGGDLWYATLQEKEGSVMLDSSQPFLQTQFIAQNASLSPDGRYLVYESNESGQPEIFVRPFPEGKSRWQVSSNGGTVPLWQGNKIFYHTGAAIMSVQVETNGTFLAGRVDKLFDYPGVGVRESDFSVSTDGRRFLIVQLAGEAAQSQTTITVVENWHREFEDQEATP